MDFYTEHAREILDMPPEWDSYKWEALGRTSVEPTQVFAITGAVAPLKTRGPNKGQRNWNKLDPATKRTAYIKPDEHEKWLISWEEQTGKCHECAGTGKRNAGWSKANGTLLVPCKRCNTTGKSNH